MCSILGMFLALCGAQPQKHKKDQKGTEIYSADVFVILHLQFPRHVHSAPVI